MASKPAKDSVSEAIGTTMTVGETPATQLLGFIAGAIISISALPRVWSIVRNPRQAAAEPISRNAMLATGNMLWVIYGIQTAALAVAVMCAIAGVLNGLVLAFAITARRLRGSAPIT
jgi:uncharacterized protein with PQ loop repeat